MCDPVTMAIASGVGSGYLAAGATIAGTTIGTGAAIGIGLTVGTTVLQYTSMKQQEN